ncbi:MAG: hypothetical protein KGI49_01880 [Patescibacteria group bacterium]|nr:hypothetical protein [Patescibacteria group bacterium]
MDYLHWDEKTITDFSEENIAAMYDRGYVFTRIGKGVMQQTRSVRINLLKFELSSENRRILKKMDSGVYLKVIRIPDDMLDGIYDWSIHKMGTDFYSKKFGDSVFSANKIKDLILNKEKSNFNRLLVYTEDELGNYFQIGYCIAYENTKMIHYSYPFYDLEKSPKDMGMGMMLEGIDYAKKTGKQHIYLGSLQRPTDTYKLQFAGLEWFDGKEWKNDIHEVKKLLSTL